MACRSGGKKKKKTKQVGKHIGEHVRVEEGRG